MTLNEIKQAITEGRKVYFRSNMYEVVCDKNGEYLIVCESNGYTIGLVWMDGVTLNGDEVDFYTDEKVPTGKASIENVLIDTKYTMTGVSMCMIRGKKISFKYSVDVMLSGYDIEKKEANLEHVVGPCILKADDEEIMSEDVKKILVNAVVKTTSLLCKIDPNEIALKIATEMQYSDELKSIVSGD